MPRRRTALFVAINQRYINPTNSLLPAVFAQFCDVHCYGPGFVSESTLARGIARYADSIGGVDLIVTTSQFAGDSTPDRLNRFYARNSVLLNGGTVTPAFRNDVGAFFRANRARVVCALTDLDPHAVQQSTLDTLLDHSGYFMGWGHGFLGALRDPDAVKKEKYLQAKLNRSMTLGLLDGFVERYRTCVINLGHFVAETEFCWNDLATRAYDAAVPGSGYSRRRDATHALRAIRGIRTAGLRYRYVFKMAERLALRPYANFYLVHLYNLAFQRTLGQSKVCVTEGGANNYPVRKFFEIPAAGALMVCWPSVGLELLGFKDGANCVFINDPSDVGRIVEAVARHVDRFEDVAAAGRSLVFREHSLSARARQIQQAIDLIDARAFHGSVWRDGRFICESDSPGVRDSDYAGTGAGESR